MTSAYAEVNGLKMYYEIHGEGKPLVLIHGGGSTIDTNFGSMLPLLATNRKLIAIEMQAHGRTADRDTALTFEQDADDVAALLTQLGIAKADVFGFSNGGQTLIAFCLRHPQLINKSIIASAFYKRSAAVPQFWDGFAGATIDMMPKELHDGYLKVNNDVAGLQNMFNRDVQRMSNFKGWSDGEMQSIKNACLVVNGNNDVGSLEHAVEMYRQLPNAELLIVPGGHGDYLGSIEAMQGVEWKGTWFIQLINAFLDKE